MSSGGLERRQHPRVRGVLDGVRTGIFEVPLQVSDLSITGCFVHSLNDPPAVGRVLSIRLDLPGGEPVELQVEVVSGSRGGCGYGVRFRNLSADGQAQVQRALDHFAREQS